MRAKAGLLLLGGALASCGKAGPDTADAGHLDVAVHHRDAAVTSEASPWDARNPDAVTEPDAPADAHPADAGAGPCHGPDSGPEVPCSGPGGGGHVRITMAYWAGSSAYGDYLRELVAAIPAGHVDLNRLSSALPGGVDLIVDLHWELFDYTTHRARSDLEGRLDAVEAAVCPVLNRVRALHLIDEPYIASHRIPRSELGTVISAVKNRFPEIPTYITFAHDCFDPSSSDPVCTVPDRNRGIPDGLDWVGFDWYNDSNDLSVASQHIDTKIAPTVARIRQLAPTARIILVPEAYTDGNRTEYAVVFVLYDYFKLASENLSIHGVDFFLWADVPQEGFLGLHSLDSARAAARMFGRWVRKGCGESPDLIPISQWYSASGPDYRYEPWIWEERRPGYRVDGVAFALPPEGTPGTVPLYHCLVDRTTSVDSYLTTDPRCDGAPTVAQPVVLGGIYTSQAPGTVQLHQYEQRGFPWDHAYTISPNAQLPPGYEYKWPIGWVHPPSAL